MKTSVSGDLMMMVESSAELDDMCKQWRMIFVSASSCVDDGSETLWHMVASPFELHTRVSIHKVYASAVKFWSILVLLPFLKKKFDQTLFVFLTGQKCFPVSWNFSQASLGVVLRILFSLSQSPLLTMGNWNL